MRIESINTESIFYPKSTEYAQRARVIATDQMHLAGFCSVWIDK